MRVVLGTFARNAIEARFGKDFAAGVQAALVHYARRLRSARRPAGLPDFRRGKAPPGTAIEVELAVGSEVELALRREGREQGASLEEIASHAVIVYLADMEVSSAGAPAPRLRAAGGDVVLG